MPKGYQGAKKVGEFKSSRFEQRPPGINYFSLKDGQTAVVRFLQNHEDIDWARKWTIGTYPKSELVNCVDQHEDGTPDPGYAAGLKSGFKAYPTMIWRAAPIYRRDHEKKIVKDSNGNREIVGYADQVAVWECSYAVYEILSEKELKYRGLMNLEWEVKRRGYDKNTKYVIEPSDPTQINVPFSPADQQLAATQRIDTGVFTKVPTFDALQNYLNGGAPDATPQTFPQQAQTIATGPEGPNPFLT